MSMSTARRAALVLSIVAFSFGGFSYAHAQAGTSCNSLHPCPTGYSCNVNNVCEATGGTTQQTQPSQGGGSSSSGQPNQLFNPLGKGASLSTLLVDILQLVIRIGTVAIVLMLVVVGFMFVTAAGNTTQITKARNALMWTIIGALLLLGSEALAQGICATVQALGGGSGTCAVSNVIHV